MPIGYNNKNDYNYIQFTMEHSKTGFANKIKNNEIVVGQLKGVIDETTLCVDCNLFEGLICMVLYYAFRKLQFPKIYEDFLMAFEIWFMLIKSAKPSQKCVDMFKQIDM